MAKKLLLLPVLVVALLSGPVLADVTLVSEGTPRAPILVDPDASQRASFAADELNKYVERMSGTRLDVLESRGELPQQGIILGTSEHPVIQTLVGQGLIDLSPENPGKEGYVLKTVATSQGDYVVIGGSDENGLLYGVYEFLETAFGCGFFEDGEKIPSLPTLSVSKLDITEKPHFGMRYFPFPFEFPWNNFELFEDEWLGEVDWMAKRKLNLVDNKVINYTFSDAYADNVIPKLIEAGHLRGFRFAEYGLSGGVVEFIYGNPEYMDFREKHPDVRYIEIQVAWPSSIHYWVVHPDDPMFKQLVKREMKAYKDRCGTDHCVGAGFWAEIYPANFPTTFEERQDLLKSFIINLYAGIKEADPETVILMDTWSLNADKTIWTKELLESVLGAIPKGEGFLLWDMHNEAENLYKQYDYFWGHDWLFGVLPTFGIEEKMHGNLELLYKVTHEVAHDPKADRCRGMMVRMESTKNNTLLTDYAFELAWNPDVTVGEFLDDYARRRYSAEASGTMRDVLGILASSTYNDGISTRPSLVQLRLGGDKLPSDVSARKSYAEALGKALRMTLSVSNFEETNPLYVKDVVLIARTYLDELLDRHIVRMCDALAAGDAKQFESEAQEVFDLMGLVEMVLSSDPTFLWETKLARLQKHDLKKFKKTMLWYYPEVELPKGDYNRWEIFEMYRTYYRAQIELFINAAREALAEGKARVDYDSLVPRYRAIIDHFINNPMEVPESERFKGSPLEAAEMVESVLTPDNARE